MNDVLLLIGRVLIALVFLMIVWIGGPSAGYLNSLGFPAPAVLSPIAHAVEWIVVFGLILGAWTRYAALLGLAFVIVATATAHRYWQVPPPQQAAQYANFAKNLAILGGLLVVYVAGAGVYSVDAMLSKKRAVARP